MPDYEKQVHIPGFSGHLAGIWKQSVPHRLSTGALCERHELIAPNAEHTVLGRVYVYRLRPRAAPARVHYCLKSDNYKIKALNPPSGQAARYKIEQYAINIKIAEMRAAAAAAAAPAEDERSNGGNRLQRLLPFLIIAFLTEILIFILAYVWRGTS